jgi:hypothetical protein
MTQKKSILLGIAGVAVLAASQAQAQITYTPGDLLLNFRNTATTADPDVTIDVGNVSTFANTPGTTVVVGVGGQFADSALASALGASGLASVGFSAAAEVANGSSDNTWETRLGTSSTAPVGSVANVNSVNDKTAGNAIALIGNTAANGTQISGNLSSSGTDKGITIASATSGSYQSAAFNAGLNYNKGYTTSGASTAVEGVLASASSQYYLGLWSTPVGGPNTEWGYFDFNFYGTGGVEYISAVSAVPEPATYGMLAGLGLLGFAVRRQLRSLTA